MSLANTVGAELNSLRKRNNRLLKTRDAARAVVEKVKSKLGAKHHANLEAACNAAPTEAEWHTNLQDYRNMQNYLYNAGLNDAVNILDQRNPNFYTTDLDDDSDSTRKHPQGAREGDFYSRCQG